MDQGFSVNDSPSRDFREILLGALSRRSAQLLLLGFALALVYGHTLGVPFYFDDYTSLRENPAIRSLDPGTLWSYASARFVGYLSFALNYAAHGYELAGYHLVNILVHLAASLTVFFLVGAILRTPVLSAHCPAHVQRWLPLLAALLFALHPLQTQAVTYTTQRLASMAAFFYLMSLLFYLKARLTHVRSSRLVFAALAAASALLALFTKQNTVTLPLAVLLLEVCFLRPPRKYLGAVCGLGLAAVATLFLFFQFGLNQNFLAFLSESTQETTTVTRGEYFTLQMQVLWSYIAKFFLPVTLHLDYDLAAPETFFNLATIIYFLGHLALIAAAALLIRRSPVIAFGILFYYTAHIVESSIIPIRDFGFEHRTYLPNFGLCLLTGWVLLSILPRYLPRKAIGGIAVLLVAVLGVLAWLRNDTWLDPIAFFQHEVAVNPNNFRAHSMLGENYLRQGQAEMALQAYRNAAPLYASRIERGNNTELAYFSNIILALDETGNYDAAIAQIESMDLEAMPPEDHALFLSRRGIIYAKTERYGMAEEDFRRALELDARNFDATLNLAKVLLVTNRPTESLRLYERAFELDPNHPDVAQGLEFLRDALQGATQR